MGSGLAVAFQRQAVSHAFRLAQAPLHRQIARGDAGRHSGLPAVCRKPLSPTLSRGAAAACLMQRGTLQAALLSRVCGLNIARAI